jgi:hypothetical protein
MQIKAVLAVKRAPVVGKISPSGVWDIRELSRYGREKKETKDMKPEHHGSSAIRGRPAI